MPSPEMADIYVPVTNPDRAEALVLRNVAPAGVSLRSPR